MKTDNFFGRENYLEIIKKRVLGIKESYRQNIAIIGDELVGKTSIVLQFLNNFCDNNIVPVYLEVSSESASSFTKRFIGALLYNFLINSGIPLKEDIDYLIEKSSAYIPKTTEKIKKILASSDKRKNEFTFAELFNLPEMIYFETGKYCVVILDEFCNLEKLGFKNLYKEWSKLLLLQKHTMFIVISSLKFKAKSILSKNLSLLFGNFEIIEVTPFDIKTSEQFIEHKLNGASFEKGLKDFVVHFTGGYPLYLEVISEAVLNSSGVSFSEVMEGLLFSASGILNQRFSNYIKRFHDTENTNDYISILYCIALGHNRVKDISHFVHKNSKVILSRLEHLLEVDAITRNGDFLKINDRVFSFWLKSVYQEPLHPQKRKFDGAVADSISDFSSSSRKTVSERMLELLRMFEDEIIQVEKKKIRLNHFREIKPLEFAGRNLKEGLIGRSSDSLWIIAIKADTLTEEDIAEFAKECKKFSSKLQRKVIITLGDIDINTRLRALEEKIWAWDINRINQILDLYSKPWVIA